ncbi:MAG: phage tail protein [Puniceicoccales bacterium]|jgi:hypothetical protein|nr:phage tail protein [Puniceicoccales bacterium]
MPDQRFRILITDLGRAKLAAAIANGTVVSLSQMAVGDGAGNATNPVPTQTGLVREVWRGGINYLSPDPANPAYAIAEVVIPTDVGGWTVREVGVFDDAGALIAVGNVGDTYKPVATEGSTREMVLRVVMEVANTDAVNLVIDATVVLATRRYVDDKANLATLIPGGTAGQVLSKLTNQDGQVAWADPAEAVSMVDAREEQQTLSAGQTVVTLNTLSTAGVAIYVNGTRLYPGLGFTVTGGTTLTLASAANAGQRLLAVKNAPAEPLGYAEKSRNLADLANIQTARANLGISDAQLSGLVTTMIAAMEPVGTVWFSTNSANPATYKGFGTWELYAQGRTIFGHAAADTDFNAAGRTGGGKTHTLSIANLPPHTHTVDSFTFATSAAGSHTHSVAAQTVTTGGGGVHKHTYAGVARLNTDKGQFGIMQGGDLDGWPNGGWNWVDATWAQNEAPAHTHSLTIPAHATAAAGDHTHSITFPQKATTSVGSGSAINHMPPYIVTYIWRRTA